MLPSQQSTMAEDMQAYRQAIFASANGTINSKYARHDASGTPLTSAYQTLRS